MAPQLKDNLSSGSMDTEKVDRAILSGRAVASPSPGEEVVISGLSGRYPDSDNVYHFRDNLFNHVDLVSGDERRWKHTHPEIPTRGGKINDIDKFDSGFFGVHYKQVEYMEPQCRLVLQHAVEAVLDAGVNPSELRGSRTGVFVGTCFSESEKYLFYNKLEPKTFPITGCAKSMFANRISYYLQLKGPSFVLDTACGSSSYAFEQAYSFIRSGVCDSAIVTGSNLCLQPCVSLQFARLGVLSQDGTCRVFDDNAKGYARSEAVCCVFLQKAKDARRIYAQIVHAKTNCDGYKEQGINYPSGKAQSVLLREFYQESLVNPASLSFLEAHGTGTRVGDPEEVNALEGIFCTGRKDPLLIGSVKSNIGHTEPASGLCSVTKVIIGMETGYIPPNMYYNKPRNGITALENGKMVVVTGKTPWQDNRGLAGVNSFGFGGANCHALLRWNKREKVNRGLPKDDLPRVVCLASRVKHGISSIQDDLKNRTLDAEYVALFHKLFRYNIPSFRYRGYSIISKQGEILRSSKFFEETTKPLFVVFSEPTANWSYITKDLFSLPLFAATIQRIHDTLVTEGLNVTDLILSTTDSVPNLILINAIVQIGIVDIFKALDVRLDYVTGFSYSIFVAAYAAGTLTVEQCVLAVFHLVTLLKNSEQLPANQRLQAIGAKLLTYLKQIIPKPLQHPHGYLCGTKNETYKYASAEYFIECLLTPQSKKNNVSLIPSDTVKLYLGSSAPGKNNIEEERIVFDSIEHKNGVVALLDVLGRLYEYGFDLDLEQLYPKVEYPVSRGTPMISPLLKWDHSKEWYVAYYSPVEAIKTGERIVSVQASEIDWSFVMDHVIDGRHLFPATGYLYVVWETLAMMLELLISDTCVVFENIKFHRACTVQRDRKLELVVMIQRGSGNFEIVESGQAIVTGTVYASKSMTDDRHYLPLPVENEHYPPLNQKDIYKEFRLRGYNYRGLFKGLKSCDNTASVGKIEWTGNWISFMDTMLQIQLLQVDTRLLFVPTSIKRLKIDAKRHFLFSQSNQHSEENPKTPVLYPIHVVKDAKLIVSGGIEVYDLQASSIARKKPRSEPVLEKHVFVPNETSLTLQQSVRVNMQLVLENCYSIKVKVIELEDEETHDGIEPLAPIVSDVLGDQPLIQPEIALLTKREVEIANVVVENKKLAAGNDCSVVIASNLLARPLVLQQAFSALKERGFVISRESLSFDPSTIISPDLKIVTIHETGKEKLITIRKTTKLKPSIEINVTDEEHTFNWLPTLQNAFKTNNGIIVYSQGNPYSGIMGLFNCLRRERGGDDVRCYFVSGGAPIFDRSSDFYKKQLEKDLAVNVFRDGKWGTYRHLLLEDAGLVEREHCYVTNLVRGDLSSLSWIEGPLSSSKVLEECEKTLVHIYYASLNFRDVMTASGRISADVITMDRAEQECVQGFEFSGRDTKGNRVMAMVTSGALSTFMKADSYLLWEVPEDWSLEDAATVPVVYATVIYGLLVRVSLKKGNAVLIHSGSGGIGQAAIQICLHFGCTVYTTVGTEEKREFLKKRFPQLKDHHIFNSRNTTFEQNILKRTRGRGVDIVLNSLAEEKLQASVRCLARGGKFVEIGKYDLALDNPLTSELFARGGSFHGVMLDGLFKESPNIKSKIGALMLAGIKSKAIRPLTRTVFQDTDIEKAFRYMAVGKHIGKVVIKVRQEEKQLKVPPRIRMKDGIPRYYCDPNKTYIITGGLGGFGLELADWLVIRGARKVILTSRNGIKTGYQGYRIRIWRSYGALIHISTEDITTEQGCVNLLEEAKQFGPVDAIFNLAVVLKDAILENQTVENYKQSFAPKAVAVKHLDKVSRTLCPNLRDFIVFSSVTCGRGNAGQTPYGMANSVMERICELRKNDGYPAVAIQWGAIGEVGLVAEMQEESVELEIGGTLQQRITSCLQTMDMLLAQNESVVSSMVVAEKRGGYGRADNVVDCVATIMGIKNLKTVSVNSSLAELGMDSMMAVEIKQTLEREFEVFLTPQDLRSLTFARLYEIKAEQEIEKSKTTKEPTAEVLPKGLNLLLRCLGDEQMANLEIVRLPSLVSETAHATNVYFLPGLEGMASVLEPLAANTAVHALSLQFSCEKPADTIPEIALQILPVITRYISKGSSFTLAAYSFGAAVALELVALLEQQGFTGNVILIDGAPAMLRELGKQQLEIESEALFETSLLVVVMSLYMPFETINKLKEPIFKCATYQDRMEVVLENSPKNSPYSKKYIKQIADAFHKRIKAIVRYEPTFPKLKSEVHLYRPISASLHNIAQDYGLSEVTEKPVNVTFFEGNHLTILENAEVAEAITKIATGEVEQNLGDRLDGKEHIADEIKAKQVSIA